MRTLDARNLSAGEISGYLQYVIAPRPICLASTIDGNGNVNLSPFSFFNLFSTNPPVCIFSPARRVRDNTPKHTLENLLEVPEVVINIVHYDMVQQMSLSSTEYEKGVNEFEKAGFTMLPSELIRPPRVKESNIQLECTVDRVIPLGPGNGAGNLVLAEIQLIHMAEDIFGEDGKIDQASLGLVARLGGDWYCRVTEDNLFRVTKPLTSRGIGIDALPFSARHLGILSGNDLGILGNLERLPSAEELYSCSQVRMIRDILSKFSATDHQSTKMLHGLARALIKSGSLRQALEVVMLAG